MRHLTDALSSEENLEKITIEQVTHDKINIHFSGDQLLQLHRLAGNSVFTIQDVMTAYIILTLNTHCLENIEQRIRYTNTIVNFRGVLDSIAPAGAAANCTLRILSEKFDDPYSLPSIAASIRDSIIRSRNPLFLQSLLATADELMRDLAHDNREVNTDHFPHGIIVYSNYRYDWADLVDFGYVNKCRFHTDGTGSLFLRVFRLNPVYDGTHWIARDSMGAEVAFRIKKTIKQKFVDAWHRDIKENFVRVKQ